jgi:hypothetical protein
MPGSDYIPKNDTAFLNWVSSFTAVIIGYFTPLGLTGACTTAIEAAQSDFGAAVGLQSQKQLEAQGAVEAKKAARTALEQAVRPLVRQINNHPGMTNQMRAELGLNVPGGSGGLAFGAGPEVPSMFLETKPGQVIVHFGTDASNEQHNGKPAWARGCMIYRKKANEADFSMIAFDTASPYVDMVPGNAVDVTYKVTYRGTKETNLGPMSPEQTIAAGG